jgi:hypothetical protein
MLPLVVVAKVMAKVIRAGYARELRMHDASMVGALAVRLFVLRIRQQPVSTLASTTAMKEEGTVRKEGRKNHQTAGARGSAARSGTGARGGNATGRESARAGSAERTPPS